MRRSSNDSTTNLTSWLEHASELVSEAGETVMSSIAQASRPALVAIGVEYPEVIEEAVKNQEDPLQFDVPNDVGHSFDSKDSVVEPMSTSLPNSSSGLTSEPQKAVPDDAKPPAAAKAVPSSERVTHRSPRAPCHGARVRSRSPAPRRSSARCRSSPLPTAATRRVTQ